MTRTDSLQSTNTTTSHKYPRFLEMLSPQDRAYLVSIATEKVMKKEQLLYHQGDPSDNLFVLLSGAIKVHYVHDNGNSLTTFYYRDGMLVGAHGCTEWSGSHSWTAQAVADCRLLWIRRPDFLAFVNQSAQALRCVLAVQEFKGEQLKRVIRILAEPTLEGRIAMAIRHFASLYGLRRGDEIEIDGHITHQEIAEMVGASRQSVTTLLVSLEKSGQIRREGRRLFIPATPARREHAEPPPVPVRLVSGGRNTRVPLSV
jgi:CRP-like cAMP-binding protein